MSRQEHVYQSIARAAKDQGKQGEDTQHLPSQLSIENGVRRFLGIDEAAEGKTVILIGLQFLEFLLMKRSDIVATPAVNCHTIARVRSILESVGVTSRDLVGGRLVAAVLLQFHLLDLARNFFPSVHAGVLKQGRHDQPEHKHAHADERQGKQSQATRAGS